MRIFTITTILFTLSAAFCGCKKSKDISSENLNLLTSRKWRIPPQPSIDIPLGNGVMNAACQNDDLFHWMKNGKMIHYNGINKCIVWESETTVKDYTVDFDKMTMKLGDDDFKIHELTTSSLKLLYTINAGTQDAADTIYTYIH